MNAGAFSPAGESIHGVVITAIVTGRPDCAGRPNRSTAFFTIPAAGQKK
ncbi:MAG: hypothetical protein LBF62_02355 [Tannerellaceae bacterium]|nr:hypothetical protein [Tannerellaceae bacterium]